MVSFSLFKNVKDVYHTDDQLSWESFCDYLSEMAETYSVENKDNLPLLSSIYRFNSSKKLEDWLFSDWMALDIEHSASITEVDKVLTDSSVCALLHTSFNHTSNDHRLRIYLPLDGYIENIDDYYNTWKSIHIWMNNWSDRSCKNPNRCYFMPSNRPDYMIKKYNGDILTADIWREKYPIPIKKNIEKCIKHPIKLLDKTVNTKKKKIRHNNIFDSDLVSSEAVNSYWNNHSNWHMKMYETLCSIASRAKIMGYKITIEELTNLAIQIDNADFGGPYYSIEKLKREAEDAIKFIG